MPNPFTRITSEQLWDKICQHAWEASYAANNLSPKQAGAHAAAAEALHVVYRNRNMNNNKSSAVSLVKQKIHEHEQQDLLKQIKPLMFEGPRRSGKTQALVSYVQKFLETTASAKAVIVTPTKSQADAILKMLGQHDRVKYIIGGTSLSGPSRGMLIDDASSLIAIDDVDHLNTQSLEHLITTIRSPIPPRILCTRSLPES